MIEFPVCVPEDVKVVSGDIYDNRFAVENLLTRQEIEGTDENGIRNYWINVNNQAASFILNLGCKQTFKGIQLVNTHNSKGQNQGTKTFR